MEKYELGLNKKSFSLYYNGGEIWCEHLDSLCKEKELLKQKFKQDLIQISRPSMTSLIAVNLDETEVDQEIVDLIINSFIQMNKPLRKVVFVGLNLRMRSYVKKRNRESSFEMICINDFEKAKAWLI
jgi:hypothetical protein